jgi:hypothetical protein
MARAKACVALLVIDNEPLQREAWNDLRRARKRLDKASQDLKRHEETDEPAFHAWLAREFPTLLSSVRELAQQVQAKGHIVQTVQAEAFFTGRSPAAVWRAMQNPQPTEPQPDRERADKDGARDIEDEMSEEARRFFEGKGLDPDNPFARAFDHVDINDNRVARPKHRYFPVRADTRQLFLLQLLNNVHLDSPESIVLRVSNFFLASEDG